MEWNLDGFSLRGQRHTREKTLIDKVASICLVERAGTVGIRVVCLLDADSHTADHVFLGRATSPENPACHGKSAVHRAAATDQVAPHMPSDGIHVSEIGGADFLEQDIFSFWHLCVLFFARWFLFRRFF